MFYYFRMLFCWFTWYLCSCSVISSMCRSYSAIRGAIILQHRQMMYQYWGGENFSFNFVFTITLSCWISSECCVSNVSTKWYETDELTLYLRSRAQETQCVFPPQPNKHKACKGWGLAVVICIKNLLFLGQKKKNNHNFFYWRCQILD